MNSTNETKMDMKQAKQNNTPNIRWTLVGYDLIVYALVAVILLVLYGGMDKLSTVGIFQLAAMETAGNKEFDSETEKKGLGTPATRANIIEKLVSSGYAERKGKQILPTAAGCELIHVMPENLKSASLTAEWENQLLMMEKGKIRDDEFMDGIVSMITEILSVCRAIPEEERSRFQTAREVIGKCPICGSDVYEGKSNYYCSDRSCPFALWKSNRFLESMKKSMDKKMAVELLKRGRTHVKGLYSKKKDSKFDADLVLGVEDGKARFSLEFPKKKTNSNKQK